MSFCSELKVILFTALSKKCFIIAWKVFALTVSDAYAAYSAAAVYDPADAYARDIATPGMVAPPTAVKIGIPSQDSIRFEGDAAQAASFADTVARLKDSGAEIAEIDFTPLYEIAQMLYFGAWVAERYVATESLMATNPDALYPVTRKIIGSAVGKTAADTFKDFYKLKDLIANVKPAIDAFDLLCVPSIPTVASVAELEADPMGPNNMLGTYTNFVNLMDMSGIAVPTPARNDGRPGSVTILAEAGADAKAAALATNIEAWGSRTVVLVPRNGIVTERRRHQVEVAVAIHVSRGHRLNHVRRRQDHPPGEARIGRAVVLVPRHLAVALRGRD